MTLTNKISLIFTLFIAAIGCGGGSRGSGAQLFEGSVSDKSGREIANVSVTITSTGDSAITDTNGRFSIETETLSGDVDFLLESESFTTTARAQNLPTDAKRVNVQFVVGEGQRPTVDVGVEIKEKIPTPKPRPTARIPTPTIKPDSKPTGATPTPIRRTPSPTNDDNSGNDNNHGEDSSSHDPDHSGSGEDSNSGNGNSNSGEDSHGGGDNIATPTPAESEGNPRDGERVESEGLIEAVTSFSVVIKGITYTSTSNSEFKGKKGESLSLNDFKVGDFVKARGSYSHGVILLERLEKTN